MLKLEKTLRILMLMRRGELYRGRVFRYGRALSGCYRCNGLRLTKC